VPCSPKSAHAGSKFLPEKQELWLILFVREVVGPRVTDDYEPRQVREEAAVNNSICITKQSDLIAFFYPKIIIFFCSKGNARPGYFSLLDPTIPFSAQRNTSLTNHCKYVIFVGCVFPVSLKSTFIKSLEFFMNEVLEETVSIKFNRQIGKDIWLMGFRSVKLASLAKPGQFFMVHLDKTTKDPLLRRPFSIHRIQDKNQLMLLYKIVGKGTLLLSCLKKDDSISVIGPLGKRFHYSQST